MQQTAESTVRVLVSDDEDLVRRIVAQSLKRGGYEVVAARDGEEALEMAASDGPFHLLVTDLVMPGIKGNELAARLRAQQPELKVLFMSGFAESDILRNIPAELFLSKPFTPSQLLAKVGEMLEE